ncbi:NAD-dependent epimerase/dehydratase family protein [Muriicola soli]|uniref:NAD-dependent epimerase/dehydratase family protein n=1 Tax=Muriicola soli TaxID=2507538 RepID=A0A411E658_9FLAO|nr:NAD(P)H-binding protein [Muriicola soli]QBA63149.1 NAD-dependent epimerase/dehydratase family protein [Muriicola soli]
MSSKIGILGCGWLGFALAKKLISQEYTVLGSTTTRANLEILKQEGIVPFYVELFKDGARGDLIDFLKEVDILIVNIPPKRKSDTSDYFNKIEQLHEACKIMHVEKVIFVSSTSVYGDLQGEVTEKSKPKPVTTSAKAVFKAEKLFAEDASISSTIVRFGGLIGPDRHPVTYLSGQQNLSNGDETINLIHLEDCLDIILSIIMEDWWGKLINGVYPLHPVKSDYYVQEARKRGLALPSYTKGYAGKSGKVVKAKTLESLGFQFKKPIDGSDLQN